MKSRPIIMGAESVRAILAGRKTQTRRVVRGLGNSWHIDRLLGEWSLSEAPQRWDGRAPIWHWAGRTPPNAGDWIWKLQTAVDDTATFPIPRPYGVPGQELWVREAHRYGVHPEMWDAVEYRADGAWRKPEDIPDEATGMRFDEECEAGSERWRSPIHMPRWACRITLVLTDVRVERVQEIREAGVIAEGCGLTAWQGEPEAGWPKTAGYAELWDSLNAARGFPWADNPWVWALAFERKEQP